ncbi:single-stranded-DNA-specific exonuclease RecJ [Thermoanaerobacter pentosaceus]|uniref:Single-stranded-DNA-specific exonuclease n=1 Tax=Thermoanaerobacter pentosaceus TaxID=694059 RepID=A0ABT9M2L0_9THEO|nr:DHH family phosphoesterase [Thermoanaerobacter pentosaceus]MDP9750373.1 single-stranded-DNA-specific exonuclease [Thermoanaerobacter pentosaceus]
MLWRYNPNTKLELQRKYPVAPSDFPLSDVVKAIFESKSIAIFGDYDVDGIASSLILKNALDILGIQNKIFLPEREEGYGIKPVHVKQIKAEGFDTIITVDNGITAFEAAKAAREAGIKLIITDHHEPLVHLPEAYKIFNPKLYRGKYQEYAGAGVTYLVARELLRQKNLSVTPAMIQLAGLATVADVVPLDGNNWYLARKGLELMRKQPIKGIKEILRAAGRNHENVTGFDIGWIIAPRINATGRLKSPQMGLELLLYGTNAEEVEELNKKRLELVRYYLNLIKDREDKFPVYAFRNCPRGIIGLIAGRLTEKFKKPVIVSSVDSDGKAVSSARTYGDFDLVKAFEYISKHIAITFGGHKSAAGITYHVKDFKKLQSLLNKYTEENPPKEEVRDLDGILTRKPALEEIMTFDSFEPFGYKNPEPAFLLEGTVTDVRADQNWQLITINREFGFFLNGPYKKGDRVKLVVSPYIKDGWMKMMVLDENPVILKN